MMMKMGPFEKVSTDQAPQAIGSYSQGVRKGMPMRWLVHTSGQIGIDPKTGEFAGADVEAQAKQAMENVKAVLEAAGTNMESIMKVSIFMTDINDFQKVDAIYKSYIKDPYPARSAVQVAALPKGALVEIEAVAFG